MPSPLKKHRHERTSWLMTCGSSAFEWCFVCGAWRWLEKCGINGYVPKTKNGWRKPSGDPEINPYKSNE